MEEVDTLVIGAGQAGLAMSYHLSNAGTDHLVLEKNEILNSWRNKRWDSFTLVTPNKQLQLPGMEYQGERPDGFLTRKELLSYLDDYVQLVDPPVREGVEVTAVKLDEAGDGFLVQTDQGSYHAERVVVAAGTFQEASIPSFAADISPEVAQIHASEYRNPEQLPTGGVLVVGAGQSGCQIAEELHATGREVYLSTSRVRRLPRRYRGRDSMDWMVDVGIFDQTIDQLDSPADRFAPNPRISGAAGGHSLNLHEFAERGIHLLGHLENAAGTKLEFADDLHDNLRAADEFAEQFKEGVDKYIRARGFDAPTDDKKSSRAGYDLPHRRELDLKAQDISTVLWATGFKFDFSWIEFPIFDEFGYPIQERGVTEVPGLYFLGLHWLHTIKSGLLFGVGDDAAHIAEHIAAHTDDLRD